MARGDWPIASSSVRTSAAFWRRKGRGSHGQEADRGSAKADRVRCADLARAQPALARVQENVSGACRGGVRRSVAKVRTAADLKVALRESTKGAHRWRADDAYGARSPRVNRSATPL